MKQLDSNFWIDAATAEVPVVDWRELHPNMRVISGEPEVRYLSVSKSQDGKVDLGLWELTPCVVEDVEADELHVIVLGRATVEFLDDGRVMELRPGMFGIIRGGSRTRWTVHETIRKVYQMSL